ncbi:MAG: GGDEF domain-containing protein [Candidatus Izimaplasma sp.]|nr:GGDEF domain-containing protein [Candidatus Izimaplasma bacterium]
MPDTFDIDTLRWITISYFSGAFILALFTLNLFLVQKKAYLKQWLIYWLLVSLSYIILFHSFYYDKPFMIGIFSIFIISAGYFFYKGGSTFLKLKQPKRLNSYIVVLYTLIILSIIFADLIGWGVLIAYWGYSMFVLIIGINFYLKKLIYMKIVGVTILIFAVMIFIYPFLAFYTWFTPWGYMVFGMFGLLIGISLFQVHYHRQNEELITTQKNLRYLVHHDPLTNVYNRSFINDEFDKITKNNTLEVGLLFIDLNNFKQVNDELGHRKGDTVLIKAANVLKDICEPKGYVCRFGGDEFLVIFYDSTIKETNKYKNDIINFGKNNLIDGTKVEFAAGSAIRKTKDEDIHTLLDKAEKSMYSNKENQKSNT